jgi:hypothetical protein
MLVREGEEDIWHQREPRVQPPVRHQENPPNISIILRMRNFPMFEFAHLDFTLVQVCFTRWNAILFMLQLLHMCYNLCPSIFHSSNLT